MNYRYVARFWSKVKVGKPTECWEWTAKARNKGYGVMGLGVGATVLAHRFSYMLANGAIPEGMHVLHSCDNRLCVNPAHLRVGTNDDNIRDKVERGRAHRTAGRPGSMHNMAKLSEDDVRAIRASGEPTTVLARRYGVTSAAISYARSKGWQHVNVPVVPYGNAKSAATRGANNPIARLDDDAVRAIRASSERPGVLAKRYGITPDYVTKIRKRQAWTHVN